MEKKEDRWKKPSMPAFTSAINPGQLSIQMEPAPGQAQAARIFETRSSVVKEHFNHDMERLRQSLAPGRLEAKPAMAHSGTPADLHLAMRQSIDPRTGHVDSMKILPVAPSASLQLNANHPMHPENQLAAAMKKLGHRP
jgi:hypothetical protein